MNHSTTFAGLACVLAVLISAPSMADEEYEEADESARKCISTNRIRNTKVVDDSTILFYMRDRSVYLNVMSRKCSGLSREGRFTYRLSNTSLCQTDSIRVLFGAGAGLQEGASCRLGYFQPITEDDLERILDPEPKLPQPEPLPTAEPEDMTDGADES